MAQVFLESELQRPPKTINITIDYLRSAKGEDLYARAVVHKLGRRIASVRAEAWQANRAIPGQADAGCAPGRAGNHRNRAQIAPQ